MEHEVWSSARVWHDSLVRAEKDARTVQIWDSWQLGGDEPDQTFGHHNPAVPATAESTDAPTHEDLPAILIGHLSVAVRRCRTNSGTPKGIAISECQKDYDDDHWLGRGPRHYQGGVKGNGVDQGRHDVESDLHRRAAEADKPKADEISSSSLANEPRAVGDRGGGGTGAFASATDQPLQQSTESELLGRRNISMTQTKTVTKPMSVKDTMCWPPVRSMFWQQLPLAALLQLPSPHQPLQSEDEDKTEIIAIPGGQASYSLKQAGNIQRLKRKCQYPKCRLSRSFGLAGQKAAYCAKHKIDGMVNVASRKCAALGCARGPSFGQPGDKKPVFCSGHRLPGYINVVSRRCAHDGCRKGPSFGSIGTGNRATYCAKHKIAGMVNVVSKSCKEEGCTSVPFFGFEGGRAMFCGKHKRNGQRNLTSRRCSGPDCSTVPSYGKPGDPRPTCCTHHKPPGAINLLSPRCAAPGCRKGSGSKAFAGCTACDGKLARWPQKK